MDDKIKLKHIKLNKKNQEDLEIITKYFGVNYEVEAIRIALRKTAGDIKCQN